MKDPASIISAVAMVTRCPVERIQSNRRDAKTCRARAVAAYVVHEDSVLSWPEVAEVVGYAGHSGAHEAWQRVSNMLYRERLGIESLGVTELVRKVRELEWPRLKARGAA